MMQGTRWANSDGAPTSLIPLKTAEYRHRGRLRVFLGGPPSEECLGLTRGTVARAPQACPKSRRWTSRRSVSGAVLIVAEVRLQDREQAKQDKEKR